MIEEKPNRAAEIIGPIIFILCIAGLLWVVSVVDEKVVHELKLDEQKNIEEVSRSKEILKKLDSLEQKLENIERKNKQIKEELQQIKYLRHINGKHIQFWSGNKPLSYDRFYSTVWKVLTEAPISYKDKKGFAALIIETAATESFFGTKVAQTKGSAIGIFQMEPRTLKCLDENFLKFNKKLEKFVNHYKDKKSSDEVNLKNNLPYQIALCLVQYVRYGIHKQDLSDKFIRATLYKKRWNTEKGKASLQKFASDTTKYLNEYYI